MNETDGLQPAFQNAGCELRNWPLIWPGGKPQKFVFRWCEGIASHQQEVPQSAKAMVQTSSRVGNPGSPSKLASSAKGSFTSRDGGIGTANLTSVKRWSGGKKCKNDWNWSNPSGPSTPCASSLNTMVCLSPRVKNHRVLLRMTQGPSFRPQ